MKPFPAFARDWGWFWLLWPPSWWAILSSSKDFTSGGVLGSRVLNGVGLHVWRKRLANKLCSRRRARMRAHLPSETTRQWDQTGYMRIDDFLELDQWAGLCGELLHATFQMAEMTQPPAVTRRAYLDANTCQHRYPNLLQLITDDRLIGLLHYAAGYPGRPVVAVQCVHSALEDPTGQADPQTEWHSDTFHSAAKAWLFLHAVGAEDGPFSYWSGSHKTTAQRLQWELAASETAASHPNRLHARGSFRASEEDLVAMGYGDPMVATVPGNTLIIADTSGFHRRMPSPRTTVRVEVYFSLRRNPYWAGLFPSLLGWPVLRARWAGWLFAWYVWLHARGTPSWIPREAPGLTDSEKQGLRASAPLNSTLR